MLIHIFLLLYICLLGMAVFFKRTRFTPKMNKIFVAGALFPMFFIQTLRSVHVGVDTAAYTEGYLNINMLNESWEAANWEKLYVLLNRIVGRMSNCNPQILYGAVSAIILIGIGYFIIKNSEDITTFGPVFFFITLNHYFTSMVSLRQYCALAIGINAYTVLKNERTIKAYVKVVILILTAVLFHTTAAVLIVIPIIMSIKHINRKLVGLAVAGIGIVYALFPVLLNLAFKLFPMYYRYYEMGHEKYQGQPLGTVYTLVLLLKVLCIISVFILRAKEKENRELYALTIFSVIGAGISLMTTKVFIIWRLGYYFDIFMILMFPKLARRFERKSRVLVDIVLYGWGVMYYLFLLYVNSSGCIPYEFFWNAGV